MNVAKVKPNIPVIPTTQRSHVQGLPDVPKNCQPQLASQRKWDDETRPQAGKFNIPRPSGHEPKAENRFTLVQAETRFTLPKAETRYTIPKTKPFDFCRARASSDPTDDFCVMFHELIDDFVRLAYRVSGMEKAQKQAEIDAFREKWRPYSRADPAKFRREDMESTSR